MQTQDMIFIRRELHQIPELGFQEVKTQSYLLNVISSFPQEHLEVNRWRTGIFVRVRGRVGDKTIGYRADIDGLPITENTDLPYASMHEGKMHACGHDFHMTIALALLSFFARNPHQHHLLFIFQPAEEGPGGALPMLHSDILQRWKPDVIMALHIAPELPVGTVSSRSGLLFANTSELFIDFHGKGGHAAYPHLSFDMVTAASSFVVQAQQIISRQVDPLDSAVLTIGKITGGFVQNAIAEHARLEGTMRTLKPETMNIMKENLERLAKGIEITHRCQLSIDYGSNYYQVYNDPKWVEIFKAFVQSSHFTYQEAKPAMTGEDFGYMLKEIPGFMFWLGVDSPYGLHNEKLTPNEDALEVAYQTVKGFLETI